MTYYTRGLCTEWHFSLHFAMLILSLHIHVEFLNDERGKEKDLYVMPPLEPLIKFVILSILFLVSSLLICWLPIGDLPEF